LARVRSAVADFWEYKFSYDLNNYELRVKSHANYSGILLLISDI
jgi:hypothetical protein